MATIGGATVVFGDDFAEGFTGCGARCHQGRLYGDDRQHPAGAGSAGSYPSGY